MKIADTTKIAVISAKRIFPELVNDSKYILEHSIIFYRGNDGLIYHCNDCVNTPRLKKANPDMIERYKRAINAE